MSSLCLCHRLTVAYDGSLYHGWQRQPAVPTVAGRLAEAIYAATGESPRLLAAGRTDAGAHAQGQVVGLELKVEWQPEALLLACNRHLPDDIRVLRAGAASPGFDPRRQAWRRTYRYLVRTGAWSRPPERGYSWLVRSRLDLGRMRAAARSLVGRHDFGSFGSSPTAGGTTTRLLDRVEVVRTPTGIRVELRADAFLRGMVRAVVGGLVAVGSGRLSEAEFEALWRPGRRGTAAGYGAPARGLHLWRVDYQRSSFQGAGA